MLKTMTKPTQVGSKNSVKSAKTRASRRVADLHWQIQFTQMKLNHWQEQEDCRWMNLVRLQEHAKQKLQAAAS